MNDNALICRTLELAERGFPHTAPNPMVGALLLNDAGMVVAEGFHAKFGTLHAEVVALAKCTNGETLYVNLEPCAHHGKTPPCVDAIIRSGIKKVVVGTTDPNPIVQGRGIEKLKQAGITVSVGIEEAACRALNRRFFTFHEQKRPYIILKWAESADRLIAPLPRARLQISSGVQQSIVHKWRSEEQAIMVGTDTALIDDPELTVRIVSGRNPLRVVLDRKHKIPDTAAIFNAAAPTILFSENERTSLPKSVDFVQINFDKEMLTTVCSQLHARQIQSILVEGGAKLLTSFIEAELFDEVRILKSAIEIKNGIQAPKIDIKLTEQEHQIFTWRRDGN